MKRKEGIWIVEEKLQKGWSPRYWVEKGTAQELVKDNPYLRMREYVPAKRGRP